MAVTYRDTQYLVITNKESSKPGLDADLVVLDHAGNISQAWKFGEKGFDVVESQTPIKQPVTKLFVTRMESVPFGERFTLSDSAFKLANVNTPVRVLKVHRLSFAFNVDNNQGLEA